MARHKFEIDLEAEQFVWSPKDASGTVMGFVNAYPYRRGNVAIEILFVDLFCAGKHETAHFNHPSDGKFAVTIQCIKVDQAARGNGFGSAALASLLKVFKNNGVDRVWLEPCVLRGTKGKRLKEEELVAWYTKVGFKPAAADGSPDIMKLEMKDYSL